MKTVFLSGSRTISRLNDTIRTRIQNIIDKEFFIIIGDANGADKVLQTFLAESKYKNVTVFCAGEECRNNIGTWKVHRVKVDPSLHGRDFYTQKDIEMASLADYGLILWDGKSAGAMNNILELLKNNKIAVVYFSPEKKFFNIENIQDAQNLLNRCDKKAVDFLKKKINLSSRMNNLNVPSQGAFSF